MLKYLAVVAVVFAVAQAPVPVTGKAADNAANHGNQASYNAEKRQHPAKPTPPIAEQNQSGESIKPKSEHASSNDDQGAINVTNAASVSVAWSLPKWAVWFAWIANLALVIVGILAVIAAGWTLTHIRRQADEMKRQVDLMIDKERARIDVKVGRLNIDVMAPGMFHLKTPVLIRNIGTSRAFLMGSGANLHVEGIGEPLQGQNYWHDFDIEIPNGFIDPETATDCLSPLVYYWPGEIKLEVLATIFWEELGYGSGDISLRGFIEYETLGIRWHLDFSYKWSSYKGGVVYALSGDDEPTADADRITAGRWAKDNDQPNGEHEMRKTQKPLPLWWRIREQIRWYWIVSIKRRRAN